MPPIDKPSCMPDGDSLPEAITSCSCDLVEFYDEFPEGRTDASFAECKIMFRFGYAMFKTPEADRNREDLLRLKEFPGLAASLTESGVSAVTYCKTDRKTVRNGFRQGLTAYFFVYGGRRIGASSIWQTMSLFMLFRSREMMGYDSL